MSGYFYIRSEPGLWTVGCEDSRGQWHPDSDHSRQEDAARRVAWLNGSGRDPDWEERELTAGVDTRGRDC